MLARTHLAFGFLSGLLIMNLIPSGNIFIFFFLILFGSVLPDVDAEKSFIVNKAPWLLKPISFFTKHRGVFHSLIGAVLISGALYYFINQSYGIALFIGYTSHLLIDGFTKMGVNFLHPISKLHLSGFIETGKLLEHFIFVGIILWIIILLF